MKYLQTAEDRIGEHYNMFYRFRRRHNLFEAFYNDYDYLIINKLQEEIERRLYKELDNLSRRIYEVFTEQ